MKLGIAGLLPSHVDLVKCAAEIGYDFIESGLMMLHERFGAAEIKEFADRLEELKLPCISTHCMFPGSIRLIGKDVDRGAVENYLHAVGILRTTIQKTVRKVGFRVGYIHIDRLLRAGYNDRLGAVLNEIGKRSRRVRHGVSAVADNETVVFIVIFFDNVL